MLPGNEKLAWPGWDVCLQASLDSQAQGSAEEGPLAGQGVFTGCLTVSTLLFQLDFLIMPLLCGDVEVGFGRREFLFHACDFLM